jgi:hypothetical protein
MQARSFTEGLENRDRFREPGVGTAGDTIEEFVLNAVGAALLPEAEKKQMWREFEIRSGEICSFWGTRPMNLAKLIRNLGHCPHDRSLGLL